MVDAIHQRSMKLIIEVCIDSVESAVAAVQGGADRLELCGNLGYGGGTTPSIGLLQSIKRAVPGVPIMAMVRPRVGDFVYSEEEANVMLQDISIFKQYGVQGVVFGALTAAGDVDGSLVKELVAAAAPLEVCFHRAFDMASDLRSAWKTLSKLKGVTRVLTSGQCKYASAPEALETLAWMLDSSRLLSVNILPGSGINITTIPILCKALLSHGLKEIHLSGGKWVDGRSEHRPDGMGMGEWSIWRTDEGAIRKVRDFVDASCATADSRLVHTRILCVVWSAFKDNGHFAVVSFKARNIHLRALDPKDGHLRMTMKRELEALVGEVDLDSPRMKRRKELPAPSEVRPSTTINANDGNAIIQGTEGSFVDAGALKDQATKLWRTVKDAVNKEGNICSPAFMRLPSKRHYPDYYNFITHPICLDDIKKKIDEDKYSSLDEVRQDFELCFTNAKRYNMKDSPIWSDAKFLLKLANKEYTKLTGKKVKKNSDHDENGEEKAEGDGDDDKKKNKPPNMNRLLKSRLQKLVEKTDEETHRVLSDVFMEMPSKKDYPAYYKQIKRPMCLEYIFKRLKRKEYITSEEFANEVELVYSNALEFNQDHSQIWEDANTLRDYFRQLMSDLPPPHALARYTKTTGKIKLKVPGMSSGPTTAPQLSADGPGTKPIQDHTASSLTFRLPASGTAVKSPIQVLESLPKTSTNPIVTPTVGAPMAQPLALKLTPTTTPVSATLVPTESSRVSTPVPPVAASSSNINAQTTVQQQQFSSTPHYTHYPNATYHPATQTMVNPKSTAPAAPNAAPANQLRNAHSVSRSPAPSLDGHKPLKEVFITVQPRGRSFWLDHRDGVKSWAMKLCRGEISLSIAEIKFLRDEDRDSSEEDTDAHDLDEEEEEEPVPKKRGRGRPPKNSKVKSKSTAAKRSDLVAKRTSKAPTPSHESIQVVLNGKPIGEKAEQEGVWDMELQNGTNVLEVGEKGGHVWKVYFERAATT